MDNNEHPKVDQDIKHDSYITELQPNSHENPVDQKPVKKKGTRQLAILSAALVLLIIISCVCFYLYNHLEKKNVITVIKPKITSVSSKSETVTSTQQPAYLYTYIKSTNPKTFIVTNSANKVLATVNLAQPDNQAYVYAKGSQSLLLGATEDITSVDFPGSNANYYLVNYTGSVTSISPAVASVITSNINTFSNSQYLLDNSNDLIYVQCDQSSQQCTMYSLNLLTGASKSYVTQTGDHTVDGTKTSIYLIGFDKGIVYYGSADSNSPSTSYSIVAYNLSTRKAVHAFAMPAAPPNTPVISSDLSQAIFSNQYENGTRYIVNLSSGKVSTYTSDISDNADYLWSPNDQYVAFTSPLKGVESSTPAESIDYMNLSAGQLSNIKSFGDPRYSEAQLLTWTSNNNLYYSLSQTTSANDFTNSPSFSEVSIPTGGILPDPAPSGYIFDGPLPGN